MLSTEEREAAVVVYVRYLMEKRGDERGCIEMREVREGMKEAGREIEGMIEEAMVRMEHEGE